MLFITHDLDEAIAMSDRVVVLSAGPASHPIGEFAIDLARPRDVAEVRTAPRFVELHAAIWARAARRGARGLPAAAGGLTAAEPCGTHSSRAPATCASGSSAVLVAVFVLWHVLTTPGLIPPFVFDNDRQAAFFFGEPLKIFGRIWAWFVTNADIYRHLAVTLLETVLAFGIGTALGLGCGLWLAL